MLAAKGKTAADGMTADGDAAFTAVYTPANIETDTTNYATDSRTGAAITNQLDAAKGDAVYLTRSDWTGTFPKPDGEPSDVISTWATKSTAPMQTATRLPISTKRLRMLRWWRSWILQIPATRR